MGRIITQQISDFSKGMTNDLRIGDTRYCKLMRGFDAHSFKNRLVPFRNSESGDSAPTAKNIKNFAIALRTGTTYNLFGLGTISATDDGVKIYRKTLDLAATNSLADSAWDTPAGGEGATGVEADYNLFVYYRRTDLIYGANTTTNIWSFSPNGSGFTDAARPLTHTQIFQGLVHSKDDILYIPYYNNAGAAGAKSFILKYDGTTWTNTALTLPDDLIPVSICEYGNYLAIGCQPASGFGKSIVYIWDRDASLTTLSESIDWGEGNLFILENISGYLVGISNSGAGNANTIKASHKQKIIIKLYDGGKPQFLREFNSSATSTSLTVQFNKQKVDEYLYFFLAMTFPDGNLREGLWKIGRNNQTGNWSVTLDRGQNNNTDTSSGTLAGFIIVGDFVFIGYTDTTYAVSKTNDADTYTGSTSIYETIILNEGSSRLKKKLLSVTVYHEPLPAGASVLVRYKIDDKIDDADSVTDWTTILTSDTDNDLFKTVITGLPEYKELILRLESTGGAIPVGIEYKYELKGGDIID